MSTPLPTAPMNVEFGARATRRPNYRFTTFRKALLDAGTPPCDTCELMAQCSRDRTDCDAFLEYAESGTFRRSDMMNHLRPMGGC